MEQLTTNQAVATSLEAVQHQHELHPFPTRRSSDLIAPSAHRAGNRPGTAPAPPPPQAAAKCRTTTPNRLEISRGRADRKSTRLNSSHVEISYAVFCSKKKMRSKVGKGTLAQLGRAL